MLWRRLADDLSDHLVRVSTTSSTDLDGALAYLVCTKGGVATLYTHGGVAIVGAEEVQPADGNARAFVPARMRFPYIRSRQIDGSVLLLTRDHFPLWRLRDGTPAEPVAPWAAVQSQADEYLWTPDRAPWRDRETASSMQDLLHSAGASDVAPLLEALLLMCENAIDNPKVAVRMLAESPKSTQIVP